MEMEERLPPAGDANDDPLTRQPPSDTYVVQVPKDQIYRVPPPENALILERYRNPAHHERSCCSCMLWILILILLIAVILGIFVGLISVVIQPQSPRFDVERVLVNNSNNSRLHQGHSKYQVSLKAYNPNKNMGILYQRGGDAFLSSRQKEIATGRPPAFFQANEKSTIFHVVLTGTSNIKLPREIQRGMEGEEKKAHVALSLSVNVPVTMKLGVLKTWTMDMAVACDFRVSKLVKGTHVLAQRCRAMLQLERRP